MYCEFCGSTGPVDCAVCRAFAPEVVTVNAVETPEPERIGAAVTASLFLAGYALGTILTSWV